MHVKLKLQLLPFVVHLLYKNKLYNKSKVCRQQVHKLYSVSPQKSKAYDQYTTWRGTVLLIRNDIQETTIFIIHTH